MRTSPKARGTRWESHIVKMAQAYGLSAERLAEGGSSDLGDVRIQVWPTREPQRLEAALLWKRLVKSSGGKRRAPDGAPAVAVLEPSLMLRLLHAAQLLQQLLSSIESSGRSVVPSSDLLAEARALVEALPDSIIVEAKAREVLNVTRTLAQAQRKVDAVSPQVKPAKKRNERSGG